MVKGVPEKVSLRHGAVSAVGTVGAVGAVGAVDRRRLRNPNSFQSRQTDLSALPTNRCGGQLGSRK